MTSHPTDTEAVALADHGYFHVGASYIEIEGRTFSQNAMYVEKFIPAEQNHDTPVVMFHGAGQTGSNYTGTPDGRRGWAHDFSDVYSVA